MIDKDALKDSLLLPKTKFPMRANLTQKQDAIIKKWDVGLIEKLKGRDKKFTLLDGPPYSNGNLHIGHAVNKILKDIYVRYHYIQGADAEFIPGWDCHGLPIEQAVEKKTKDKKDIKGFRAKCRNFAKSWIESHELQAKRMGIFANWGKKYTTMSADFELRILKKIFNSLETGRLYKSNRPVLWSVAEATALADAEVEYHDIVSPSIYVKFATDIPNMFFLAWTTTPWTLVANAMLGYNRKYRYITIKAGEHLLICAESKAEYVCNKLKLSKHAIGGVVDIVKIKSCISPITKKSVPIVHADFISLDKGTGIVHMAPSHGYDDYQTALKYNLNIPEIGMDKFSRFHADIPVVGGSVVINADGSDGDANTKVLEFLEKDGSLMLREYLQHSYPHSWRSKCKLIFMLTPQWFLNIQDLKERLLKQLDSVDLCYPEARKRLKAMIRTRPDWCVSRQRLWGVPLAIFVNKATGLPLIDADLNLRISEQLEKHGFDIWFTEPADYFLKGVENASLYEKVQDVVEVWFDSGMAFTAIDRDPDLILEGSDQHRGWFQTLLLHQMLEYGSIKCKSISTHGFVVDKDGRKMSKSAGNGIDPLYIVDQYGADILRTLVASSNVRLDISIGQEQINTCIEKYRKLRNTIRFLISVSDKESFLQGKIQYESLPLLEKYILHCMSQVKLKADSAIRQHKIHEYFKLIHEFCTQDLSSLYLEIRKDTIYCDSIDSSRRVACIATCGELLRFVLAYASPIICFTCEEAWDVITQNHTSVLTIGYHNIKSYLNEEVAMKWARINDIRKQILRMIEQKRFNNEIKSTLEAHATIGMAIDCDTYELSDYLMVSSVSFGEATRVSILDNTKCPRCWKMHSNMLEVCKRCEEILELRS